jgi:hypothetical protein
MVNIFLHIFASFSLSFSKGKSIFNVNSINVHYSSTFFSFFFHVVEFAEFILFILFYFPNFLQQIFLI